jgi:hypothetical protein
MTPGLDITGARAQIVCRLNSYSVTVMPDILNPGSQVVGEIKNVSYLSYSSQIRDYNLFALSSNYEFQLYTRSNTLLSGPLQNEVRLGNIILKQIPGK